MKKKVKFEISNRAFYTLLSVMILVLAGTVVYAYSTGGPASYVGHTTDEIEGVCLSDGTNCNFGWGSAGDGFWTETVDGSGGRSIDYPNNVSMGGLCFNNVCESTWPTGTLGLGKWCNSDGSIISCSSEEPTRTGVLIQCPPRKIRVYEYASAEEWEEHVRYDVCTRYADYVQLSVPRYCNGDTCYYIHADNRDACQGFCEEFGFIGTSGVNGVNIRNPGSFGYLINTVDWEIESVVALSANNCLCYP